jgi:hypothetical protein
MQSSGSWVNKLIIFYLNLMKKISALLFLSGFLLSLFADDHTKKPLKGLLVTGGGHHDYGFQQNVIMEGISQRLPVKWTVMFDMDALPGRMTRPLSIRSSRCTRGGCLRLRCIVRCIPTILSFEIKSLRRKAGIS